MQGDVRKIKVADIVSDYSDDGEGGVFGYSGRLVLRPKYQREFVYDARHRDAVIDTVMDGMPLGIVYWAECDDGEHDFEVLDGQQRIISICQYAAGGFEHDHMFFENLTPEDKAAFLDYELLVSFFKGGEREKLEWFRRINVAGVELTNQELLNAVYTGPWLSDAKLHFSKTNCAAAQLSDGYAKGVPIRQELLEKALAWVAARDGLKSGQDYMATHQSDADADDIWQHFQDVVGWAKRLFPKPRHGITDAVDWGALWVEHHDERYNSRDLASDMDRLLEDDDVTRHAGIIPYLLSGRGVNDERYLSIRAFTKNQKARAYKRQNGICPVCGKHFEIEQMEADHITPWSQGGHTTDDNLQMLCRDCNRRKSDK